jgi:aryl-alcohol dehydrogenase-like predicted oxidoreductase
MSTITASAGATAHPGEPSPAARSGTFVLGGDLPVHRLGFGAMRITGDGVWGEPPDHAAAIAVLRRAVALGITLIDTADSYGPEVSERLIAEALHPYPRSLVIGTKAGFDRPGPNKWRMNGRPAHLRAACEGSLRRLKLERIHLYQLHRIDPSVPMEDQVGTFKQLQDEGKIRHIGLSEVSVADIERVRRLVSVVSVQNRYSVADRYYEDVVDYCSREGIAFLPWFPLASGGLARTRSPLARMAARFGRRGLTERSLSRIAERLQATPAQVALAWLLRRSPVMLPIPGTGNVAHLAENIDAALLELDEPDFQEIASTRGA